MIIETILSSTSATGAVNFAPVGVHVPDDHGGKLSEVKGIVLYLYPGSNTFLNLRTTPEGVINFTDDVVSFVDTALYAGTLPTARSAQVLPPRMAEARAIWEFVVTGFDASAEPARVTGEVLLFREFAGFTGFIRAQGAVIEAAITATRLAWIPPDKVNRSWPLWQEIVEKTGGRREKEAFRKLTEYMIRHAGEKRGFPGPDRPGGTISDRQEGVQI
jgi:hypothetical protein